MPLLWVYLAGTAIVSGIFLLRPAIRWLHEQTTPAALAFFNLACLYPLALFAVLAASVIIGTAIR